MNQRGNRRTAYVARAVAAAVALGLAALASFPKDRITLDEAVTAVTAQGAYATDEALSSPEFQGRLTGTDGFRKASAWVAAQAKAAGLKPLPGNPDYFQAFLVTIPGVEGAQMELLPADDKGQPQKLELFKEFMPILSSASGDVTAEVVFVGFGITAPELGRDDYAGLDVKGKVVVTLRGEPKDGHDWGKHNDSHVRYANAKAHGAAACLLADQAVASPNGEPLEGMPTGEVSSDFCNVLLAGKGLKAEDIRKVLEAGGLASFPTGRKVHFAVQARPPKRGEGRNVIAVLSGGDPKLKGDYILIGAHLDHCGNWPELLPGADDNASGSATVLEIAKAAARLSPKPKRTLVFCWFGGEEMGLLGSKYLAANPPPGLGRCVAMINLDMVGVGNGAYVASGKDFPEIGSALEAARDRRQPGFKLALGQSRGGESRDDHGPFQKAGLHAVALFGSGGSHHGYHTPDDTLYFITPKSMEAVGRIVLDASVNLADAP